MSCARSAASPGLRSAVVPARLAGLPTAHAASATTAVLPQAGGRQVRRSGRPLAALLVSSLAGLWCLSGIAQTDEDYSARPSVQWGETDLYPSLRIGYERNSNAFLTPDDETSANDLLISPEVVWLADRRTLSIEGRYAGDYRSSSESALNRNDHLLGVTADAGFGVRQRLVAGASYQRGSEAVGTELTRGDSQDFDEPAVFNEFNAEARYIYGAEGARGNIELGLRMRNFSYEPLRRLSTNEDITDGRGYTLFEPFGVFSLRLSPDTRALLGVEVGQYSYDQDTRDRQDLTVFTGLNFSATGKLAGDLQLGATTASFDNLDRDDQQTLTARVSLTYRPVDFSRFVLTFDRQFDNRTSAAIVDPTSGELTTAGDVLTVEDLLRLDWQYYWSSRFYHRAYFQLTQRDRECPEVDDDVTSGGLELNLLVRRWIEAGIGVTTARRTGSSGCDEPDAADGSSLDYDRQTIGAHVRFTL